jgi:hypothetical protein
MQDIPTRLNFEQLSSVLEFCKGPEDERRFAGLLLLSKIEGAREHLVSEEGS